MMATAGASDASSPPPTSTGAFATIRSEAGIGCCSSSFKAPLCRSPETSRMPTNGSRNAAASSHALNVGAHTPMSGEKASPTPAAVPFKPLASAYVRTALMNDTPTSGPITRSRTHHERDERSSRPSLSSSQTKAGLREGKEHLFEILVAALRPGGARPSTFASGRRQLVERPLAADAAAAQQHESIADACRVGDLMDRQHHRAARR